MAVSINVFEEGALVVQRDLEAMGERVIYTHPLWMRVHARLRTIESLQFQSTGRRGGPNPWAPSNPNTVAEKRLKGLSTKNMHATLALRDSLRNMDDPHHIWEETPWTIEFGSDLIQFKVHQDESAVIARGIPFRPPIDLTAFDQVRLVKMIEDYVVSGYARTAVAPE